MQTKNEERCGVGFVTSRIFVRYEGQAAFERAVRDMWKRNSHRACKIGLPELPRVGA